MNILVLTSAYPQEDDIGVVTPTVKYFSETWAKQGHSVIVVHNSSCFPKFFFMIPQKIRDLCSSYAGFTFPSIKSRNPIEKREENLLVSRMPMEKFIPHGRFSKKTIKKQLDSIRALLNREQFVPDLIIGHWLNPQIEMLSKLGIEYNAKTSIVFHNDCSEKTIERFALLDRINELDAVGCRSKTYAQHVREALNLDKMPFVCYSGIPDEFAEECERKLENRKFDNIDEFLYVGRLVKYKRVDAILEALHQVYQDRPFRFNIVGSGEEKDNLQRIVQRYKMNDRVNFLGKLSRVEAFQMMNSSTYFIMISEGETFGMVYIEAMLAGCITIASKYGGVDGVIVDGLNGFLSEEGDSSKLAEKLQAILKLGSESKKTIRVNAIKKALEFKDSSIAKQYLKNVLEWKEQVNEDKNVNA